MEYSSGKVDTIMSELPLEASKKSHVELHQPVQTAEITGKLESDDFGFKTQETMQHACQGNGRTLEGESFSESPASANVDVKECEAGNQMLMLEKHLEKDGSAEAFEKTGGEGEGEPFAKQCNRKSCVEDVTETEFLGKTKEPEPEVVEEGKTGHQDSSRLEHIMVSGKEVSSLEKSVEDIVSERPDEDYGQDAKSGTTLVHHPDETKTLSGSNEMEDGMECKSKPTGFSPYSAPEVDISPELQNPDTVVMGVDPVNESNVTEHQVEASDSIFDRSAVLDFHAVEKCEEGFTEQRKSNIGKPDDCIPVANEELRDAETTVATKEVTPILAQVDLTEEAESPLSEKAKIGDEYEVSKRTEITAATHVSAQKDPAVIEEAVVGKLIENRFELDEQVIQEKDATVQKETQAEEESESGENADNAIAEQASEKKSVLPPEGADRLNNEVEKVGEIPSIECKEQIIKKIEEAPSSKEIQSRIFTEANESKEITVAKNQSAEKENLPLFQEAGQLNGGVDRVETEKMNDVSSFKTEELVHEAKETQAKYKSETSESTEIAIAEYSSIDENQVQSHTEEEGKSGALDVTVEKQEEILERELKETENVNNEVIVAPVTQAEEESETQKDLEVVMAQHSSTVKEHEVSRRVDADITTKEQIIEETNAAKEPDVLAEEDDMALAEQNQVTCSAEDAEPDISEGPSQEPHLPLPVDVSGQPAEELLEHGPANSESMPHVVESDMKEAVKVDEVPSADHLPSEEVALPQDKVGTAKDVSEVKSQARCTDAPLEEIDKKKEDTATSDEGAEKEIPSKEDAFQEKRMQHVLDEPPAAGSDEHVEVTLEKPSTDVSEDPVTVPQEEPEVHEAQEDDRSGKTQDVPVEEDKTWMVAAGNRTTESDQAEHGEDVSMRAETQSEEYIDKSQDSEIVVSSELVDMTQGKTDELEELDQKSSDQFVHLNDTGCAMAGDEASNNTESLPESLETEKSVLEENSASKNPEGQPEKDYKLENVAVDLKAEASFIEEETDPANAGKYISCAELPSEDMGHEAPRETKEDTFEKPKESHIVDDVNVMLDKECTPNEASGIEIKEKMESTSEDERHGTVDETSDVTELKGEKHDDIEKTGEDEKQAKLQHDVNLESSLGADVSEEKCSEEKDVQTNGAPQPKVEASESPKETTQAEDEANIHSHEETMKPESRTTAQEVTLEAEAPEVSTEIRNADKQAASEEVTTTSEPEKQCEKTIGVDDSAVRKVSSEEVHDAEAMMRNDQGKTDEIKALDETSNQGIEMDKEVVCDEALDNSGSIPASSVTEKSISEESTIPKNPDEKLVEDNKQEHFVVDSKLAPHMIGEVDDPADAGKTISGAEPGSEDQSCEALSGTEEDTFHKPDESTTADDANKINDRECISTEMSNITEKSESELHESVHDNTDAAELTEEKQNDTWKVGEAEEEVKMQSYVKPEPSLAAEVREVKCLEAEDLQRNGVPKAEAEASKSLQEKLQVEDKANIHSHEETIKPGTQGKDSETTAEVISGAEASELSPALEDAIKQAMPEEVTTNSDAEKQCEKTTRADDLIEDKVSCEEGKTDQLKESDENSSNQNVQMDENVLDEASEISESLPVSSRTDETILEESSSSKMSLEEDNKLEYEPLDPKLSADVMGEDTDQGDVGEKVSCAFEPAFDDRSYEELSGSKEDTLEKLVESSIADDANKNTDQECTSNEMISVEIKEKTEFMSETKQQETANGSTEAVKLPEEHEDTAEAAEDAMDEKALCDVNSKSLSATEVTDEKCLEEEDTRTKGTPSEVDVNESLKEPPRVEDEVIVLTHKETTKAEIHGNDGETTPVVLSHTEAREVELKDANKQATSEEVTISSEPEKQCEKQPGSNDSIDDEVSSKEVDDGEGKAHETESLKEQVTAEVTDPENIHTSLSAECTTIEENEVNTAEVTTKRSEYECIAEDSEKAKMVEHGSVSILQTKERGEKTSSNFLSQHSVPEQEKPEGEAAVEVPNDEHEETTARPEEDPSSKQSETETVDAVEGTDEEKKLEPTGSTKEINETSRDIINVSDSQCTESVPGEEPTSDKSRELDAQVLTPSPVLVPEKEEKETSVAVEEAEEETERVAVRQQNKSTELSSAAEVTKEACLEKEKPAVQGDTKGNGDRQDTPYVVDGEEAAKGEDLSLENLKEESKTEYVDSPSGEERAETNSPADLSLEQAEMTQETRADIQMEEQLSRSEDSANRNSNVKESTVEDDKLHVRIINEKHHGDEDVDGYIGGSESIKQVLEEDTVPERDCTTASAENDEEAVCGEQAGEVLENKEISAITSELSTKQEQEIPEEHDEQNFVSNEPAGTTVEDAKEKDVTKSVVQENESLELSSAAVVAKEKSIDKDNHTEDAAAGKEAAKDTPRAEREDHGTLVEALELEPSKTESRTKYVESPSTIEKSTETTTATDLSLEKAGMTQQATSEIEMEEKFSGSLVSECRNLNVEEASIKVDEQHEDIIDEKRECGRVTAKSDEATACDKQTKEEILENEGALASTCVLPTSEEQDMAEEHDEQKVVSMEQDGTTAEDGKEENVAADLVVQEIESLKLSSAAEVTKEECTEKDEQIEDEATAANEAAADIADKEDEDRNAPVQSLEVVPQEKESTKEYGESPSTDEKSSETNKETETTSGLMSKTSEVIEQVEAEKTRTEEKKVGSKDSQVMSSISEEVMVEVGPSDITRDETSREKDDSRPGKAHERESGEGEKATPEISSGNLTISKEGDSGIVHADENSVSGLSPTVAEKDNDDELRIVSDALAKDSDERVKENVSGDAETSYDESNAANPTVEATATSSGKAEQDETVQESASEILTVSKDVEVKSAASDALTGDIDPESHSSDALDTNETKTGQILDEEHAAHGEADGSASVKEEVTEKGSTPGESHAARADEDIAAKDLCEQTRDGNLESKPDSIGKSELSITEVVKSDKSRDEQVSISTEEMQEVEDVKKEILEEPDSCSKKIKPAAPEISSCEAQEDEKPVEQSNIDLEQGSQDAAEPAIARCAGEELGGTQTDSRFAKGSVGPVEAKDIMKETTIEDMGVAGSKLETEGIPGEVSLLDSSDNKVVQAPESALPLEAKNIDTTKVTEEIEETMKEVELKHKENVEVTSTELMLDFKVHEASPQPDDNEIKEKHSEVETRDSVAKEESEKTIKVDEISWNIAPTEEKQEPVKFHSVAEEATEETSQDKKLKDEEVMEEEMETSKSGIHELQNQEDVKDRVTDEGTVHNKPNLVIVEPKEVKRIPHEDEGKTAHEEVAAPIFENEKSNFENKLTESIYLNREEHSTNGKVDQSPIIEEEVIEKSCIIEETQAASKKRDSTVVPAEDIAAKDINEQVVAGNLETNVHLVGKSESFVTDKSLEISTPVEETKEAKDINKEIPEEADDSFEKTGPAEPEISLSEAQQDEKPVELSTISLEQETQEAAKTEIGLGAEKIEEETKTLQMATEPVSGSADPVESTVTIEETTAKSMLAAGSELEKTGDSEEVSLPSSFSAVEEELQRQQYALGTEVTEKVFIQEAREVSPAELGESVSAVEVHGIVNQLEDMEIREKHFEVTTENSGAEGQPGNITEAVESLLDIASREEKQESSEPQLMAKGTIEEIHPVNKAMDEEVIEEVMGTLKSGSHELQNQEERSLDEGRAENETYPVVVGKHEAAKSFPHEEEEEEEEAKTVLGAAAELRVEKEKSETNLGNSLTETIALKEEEKETSEEEVAPAHRAFGSSNQEQEEESIPTIKLQGTNPSDRSLSEMTDTVVSTSQGNVSSKLDETVAKAFEKPEESIIESENPLPEHGGEKIILTSCRKEHDEPASTDMATVAPSDLLKDPANEKLQVPIPPHCVEPSDAVGSSLEMPPEEAKIDEECDEANEDEDTRRSPEQDAPLMVESSKDMDTKAHHKKSHNILSGVGSKVKHSISKVKKAIIGKSSHAKAHSPKQGS